MPLLALETHLYPQDLLGRSASDPEQHRWWVLRTRPRTEKTLARLCAVRQLPFYLPLYHKRWRSGARLQSSYPPLFPGYLFLRGDELTRQAALETRFVAQVLMVADQSQLHADLVRVHHLIQVGAPLTPEDRLQPGARVLITRGPLAGLEGKLVRRDKSTRFFLEVRMLQRAVSVEIDNAMVAPLN